ncbi:cytidylyltransferase domain-containing protein [Nostoc sp. CALU 1950]|uniref:acylneuraminate cytidylyltransferase family protein n=1 Tax=Nostoc sp. CALU 1950 TaxID=3104321 RepID=UPI003EBA56BE
MTCFLPCRKGSERVPKKNIRPFGGYSHGLIELKLMQLSQVKFINEIVLSTNDDELIKFAKSIDLKNLCIHQRDEKLASSQTSTDELINHVADLIHEGHILWTHVTSPFLTANAYERIIQKYLEGLEQGYDSLMTTSLIRSFVWNSTGPLNYDKSIEKWPRTQTLEPLHEINSAIFLGHIDIYKFLQDRVGVRPILYPLNKIEGFDIDWSEDFLMAEYLLNAKIASI